MAIGLSDHLWSVHELLKYKVAPQPLTQPKKRGRPAQAKAENITGAVPKRGRPPKRSVLSGRLDLKKQTSNQGIIYAEEY